MKTRNYLSYLILPALALCCVACVDPLRPSGGQPAEDHCIELTLANLHPTLITKAGTEQGDDTYNENLVQSVDCFFYPDGATGSPAVFSALGRGVTAQAEGDSTIYKVKVFFTDDDATRMFGSTTEGTCQVFVICNAPLTYGEDTSVDALRELVVESDFSAQIKQASFVMPAEEPATVTLTTTGSGDDVVRSAAGRVHVKRSAAKVQIFLSLPEKYVDQLGEYEPVPDVPIEVMMLNEVKRGKVDGSYSVQNSDYVDTPYRLMAKLEDAALVEGYEAYNYTHAPFYSYPVEWQDLGQNAPLIIFRIPWRIVGTTNYEYRRYQVNPNLANLQFEANHCYRTFVNIASMGAEDEADAVWITDNDYVILDWIDESASGGQGVVPGELKTYAYLVVDIPELTLNNQETAKFTYVSSSPLSSVEITRIDYYDNSQADPAQSSTTVYTVTEDTETVSTVIGDIDVNMETPGLLTFTHSLDDLYSSVTIYVTITNGDGNTQDLVITQNPSISLIRLMDAGDVFVNGYFGRVSDATYAVAYYPYSSYEADYLRYNNRYYQISETGSLSRVSNPRFSGGTWVTAGQLTNGDSYEQYFYTDTNQYYHCTALWNGGVSQQVADEYDEDTQSGTYGDVLGSIRSMNETIDRNFYTTRINVSSFNDANNTYTANGASVEYRIGDPRVPASTHYTGDASWDIVTNFYKYLYYDGTTEKFAAWSDPGNIMIASQAEDGRNIISPSFLVSSSLNSNLGLTFDQAVKRAATYQEAGYPAGRWRLPTEAEIAFIVARQNDGTIPALYATDTDYWAGSGRLVYVPTDASDGITFHDPTEEKQSVRFVYDLWRWGEEPAATNVYHPNGHNTTY